jgi:lipopolysaccharide transport system ATP-binding protein
VSEAIITVENLSKRYRIGVREKTNKSFREVFLEGITAPIRNLRRLSKMTKFEENNGFNDSNQGVAAESGSDIIWALKDVSFEVKEGEVLGVIGRNGAGKSTLLKILSRVTEPTTGDIKIYGKISSLLEVGTGFHPELTGRENTFLNGAILGMTKREIQQKFDEIIAFAEIEKFLDTPVKYYSSGMYVRLAFAVAAHLEPDILIVDEVLAVGDAGFQTKCLGKMGQVAREGRTVLFVSHNMAAITGFCGSAIWVNEGKIEARGKSTDIVSRYLSSLSTGNSRWERPQSVSQNSRARILSAEVRASNAKAINQIDFPDTFAIELVYQILKPMRCTAGFRLKNDTGIDILCSCEADTTDWGIEVREPGIYHARAIVPGGLLRPGSYLLTFGLFIENIETIDRYENALTFEITSIDSLSDGRDGVLTPFLKWEVERINNQNQLSS